MLTNVTAENMRSLRLLGMLKAFEEQIQIKDIQDFSFEDRLGLLIDAEMISRGNKQLKGRLKSAKLRLSACIEDIDLKGGRGLDKSNLVTLATCDWLKMHRNIVITGPTGSGKTFVACAVAQKACREGFSVQYVRSSKLFQELAIGKADGRYLKMLAAIAKKDLFVIDDFALSPLTDEQRRDLLEIFEERYNCRSTIVVSQVPSDHWHDIIGDPTIADAILDRLIHNAHKLQLRTKISKRKEEHPELEF